MATISSNAIKQIERSSTATSTDAMIFENRDGVSNAATEAMIFENRDGVSNAVTEAMILENQRWQPFRGFGSALPGNMFPHDPHTWSVIASHPGDRFSGERWSDALDEDDAPTKAKKTYRCSIRHGRAVSKHEIRRLDGQGMWEPFVDFPATTDRNGWEYAFDFPHSFKTSSFGPRKRRWSHVRRRRWVFRTNTEIFHRRLQDFKDFRVSQQGKHSDSDRSDSGREAQQDRSVTFDTSTSTSAALTRAHSLTGTEMASALSECERAEDALVKRIHTQQAQVGAEAASAEAQTTATPKASLLPLAEQARMQAKAEAGVDTVWARAHLPDWELQKEVVGKEGLLLQPTGGDRENSGRGADASAGGAPLGGAAVAAGGMGGKVKVWSRGGGAPGKMWMSAAEVPCSAEAAMALLRKMEDFPEWNDQILTFDVLDCFWRGAAAEDVGTDADAGAGAGVRALADITYTVVAPQAGGLVSSRDFVDVRSFGVRRVAVADADADADADTPQQYAYVQACVGMLPREYPAMPKQRGLTRGLMAYAGYVVQPLAAGSCLIVCVNDSDVRGWVSPAMVDANMAQPMADAVLGVARRLRDGPRVPLADVGLCPEIMDRLRAGAELE